MWLGSQERTRRSDDGRLGGAEVSSVRGGPWFVLPWVDWRGLGYVGFNPMTRIERAARANAEAYGDDWEKLSEAVRAAYRRIAAAVVTAAEPELYQDPPQAWRAPMHLSDAMITAAEAKVSHMDKETGELVNFDFVQVDRMWRALRDAHLKGGMANAGSS